MIRWMSKLEKMATVIAKEKPTLHFMGLVPHHELPDRWHLLISSDKLDNRRMESLHYVVALLGKHLTLKNRVKVSRIVIMPHDKAFIKTITEPGEFKAGRLQSLYPYDPPDEVIVLWPAKSAPIMAQTA
jgi:hypothetical protein